MLLKTDKDQFLLAKKINLDLGPDVSPPKIEQFRPQKCIFFCHEEITLIKKPSNIYRHGKTAKMNASIHF